MASVPPFRADHVGSLLRPQALRQAFRDHTAKRITDAEFVRIQDAAVRDAVRMQEEVGLEVITDGEFRRGSYWGRFVERMEGFDIRPAEFKFRNDQGHEVEFTAPYAKGKLRRPQSLALDEFLPLHGMTTQTPKITLPAPSTMHFYRCTDFADPAVYRDADAFFADLTAVFREEVAELARAGCRYVQFDEVAIAMLCDPTIRAKVTAIGRDPDELVDLYIDALNQAAFGAPSDMAIGVHVCRGNFKGHYLADGGYDSVAEKFFTGIQATHFLLEFDTPRAGGFEPLRFVPATKGVVLGLVSSKTPELESLDLLRHRTEQAAAYIDLDRLAISPQCGFASTVTGNPITELQQRAKLHLLVEAARAIWH